MREHLLRRWTFWITLLALLTALVLTVISHLEVCTTACVEGQKWRILGCKFELFGLIVLPLMIISHILSLKIPIFRTITGLMLAASLGAELWFLYIQIGIVGGLCSICVSIAFAVLVAGLAYFTRFVNETLESRNEGVMQTLTKIVPSMGMMLLGFLFAFMGCSKINPLEAEQATLKDNISFGKPKTPIEVYIFTDWFCPACRRADPEIDKIIPEIQDKAKLYFVDAAVHTQSLNFTPYNLSFMINNKDKYFQIRKALEALADKNNAPSDSDIKETVKPLNVTLKELNYSDVALGVKLFKKLVKQFEVTQTPTIVIVNTNTKKGKKLSGYSEITKDNVMRAIETLQ